MDEERLGNKLSDRNIDIDEFCKEMKEKMTVKTKAEYENWRLLSEAKVRHEISRRVEILCNPERRLFVDFTPQEVDIANYCMLLWLKRKNLE